MTTAHDGLFEYGGVPVGGGRYTNPWATHWFVDGNDGSDYNDGLTPTGAKKTVQAAIAAATWGDVIYIRPIKMGSGAVWPTDLSEPGYYAETLTVPYGTQWLSMVGIQPGIKDPTYTRLVAPETINTWGLTVNAPCFHAENLAFKLYESHSVAGTPLGAVYLAATIGASGYSTAAGSVGASFYNCSFESGEVKVRGGYHSVISNCQFLNMYVSCDQATGNLWFDAHEYPAFQHEVDHCLFESSTVAAPTYDYFYVNGSQYTFWVHGCRFDRIPSSGVFYRNVGAVGGMMSDCYFNDDAVTCGTSSKEILIGSGQFEVVGCYDRSGTFIPTT
jgi:hypothetical protein